MTRRNVSVLMKRTYTYEGDHIDQYLLAGSHEECLARVERMIRNNPTAKVRKAANADSWHITPPGGEDQGFFGHKPLDLLIVSVPMSELAEVAD